MATVAGAIELLASADVSRESVQRGVPIEPAGVRLAANTGRLRVAALTPSGQRPYARNDVEQYLRERAQRRGAA